MGRSEYYPGFIMVGDVKVSNLKIIDMLTINGSNVLEYKATINDSLEINYSTNGTTHPHLTSEGFIGMCVDSVKEIKV